MVEFILSTLLGPHTKEEKNNIGGSCHKIISFVRYWKKDYVFLQNLQNFFVSHLATPTLINPSCYWRDQWVSIFTWELWSGDRVMWLLW